MIQLLYFAGAIAIGASFAIYLPMLSQIGRIVGSPALANVPFFLIGATVSAIVFLLTQRPSAVTKLAEVPPWLFLAGVVSGIVIVGTTALIPKIGPGAFFVLIVAGQVVMGAIVSHYGILESPVDPLSLKKLVGIVLVVGGAYLVSVR